MAMNFGGIVGLCQGHIIQIEGCETTAKSQLTVAADSVGGICGRFVGLGDQSYIRDCNNRAPVTGYGYVGGICGLVNNVSISNCSNSGNVWSALDLSISNRIQNPSGYYAGGIAGACIRRSTISSCNNEAGVFADSSYVGGIVGALLDGSKIYTSSNSGEVSGINQVGGIVGFLGQDAGFGTDYDGCPNHGAVKGIAQVGGLVGYAKKSALSCKGNNGGEVQYASMGGRVYGYAEEPSLFADCTYDTKTTGLGESVTWVSSVTEFRLIRYFVNNGNSYEGKTIILAKDLDLGSDWIPIGTSEQPFRGTFDGNGHKVHFTINAPDDDYQGLFGYMQGTVKNLYLDNCSVTGKDYVGGIAGYCHGTISNCGTKGSCDANAKVSGNKYVGGLAGMARYSEIHDSYNGSNVTGNQYIGGLVGDFMASKNDDSYGKPGPVQNSWGKTLYNIYGGNVSHSFNFGMVKATGDNSYVGGIAGSTSTEVKYSYNSGVADGTDKVGGIVGQLNGDSIRYCYNVGYVTATGSNKGAISGTYIPADAVSSLNSQPSSLNSQLSSLNFYDRQMCTVKDANATGCYTSEMTGEALKPVLGDDHWTYNDNEYPTIKYWNDAYPPAATVSVKPLLLYGGMTVDDIVQNFAGATGDDVNWAHYGNVTGVITVESISQQERDSIMVLDCGVDMLAVQYHNLEHRIVPIVVTGKNAVVDKVTTLYDSYTWDVNNETYTESGFYIQGEGCGEKKALDLTVAKVNCVIDKIDPTCDVNNNGMLMATATGGLGNGFRYEWTKQTNDQGEVVVGNLPNVMRCLPGDYTLTLTDSIHSDLTYKTTVTLVIQPPVSLTIAACSESRYYDGTPLTGGRFVVTEEGFAPDTIAANRLAILSNGDTLRIEVNTGSITFPGTLENAVSVVPSTLTINYEDISDDCHYNITISETPGSLTVIKRPLLIIADDMTKEYDGLPLQIEAYSHTSLPDGFRVETAGGLCTQTMVGENFCSPSEAVVRDAAGNDVTQYFDIIYVVGTLLVTPKPLTITAGDESKAYDGTPLTGSQYSSTDLATTDHFESVTIEGSQTHYGRSASVPVGAVIRNADGYDVTRCYDITYVEGTLTVNPVLFAAGATNDWMTWCDMNIYERNNDFTVYAIEGIEGSTVTVTPSLDNILPANTPLLIRRADNVTTAVVPDYKANGATAPVLVNTTGDNWAFYGNAGYDAIAPEAATFIKVNDSDIASYALRSGRFILVDQNTGLSPHRCLLNISTQTGGAAPAVLYIDGETTEITTTDYTDLTDKADVWYRLDGRRINDKPTTKGIYINKGKKRVVK